jgi:ribose transport system substrate-binding protein
VNVENYVSFIATDNHGAGREAARLLAGLVNGRGGVAMLMHKPGGTSTNLREQGFEETLRKEFPALRLVAKQYGMSDAARARAAAENILTAQPDLAGLFASSEASSLGAIQAIKSRGLAGRVKLVTFDTSDAHVEALKQDVIDVMLVQDAFQLGYQAVRSLARKLRGETPQRTVEIPARAVRKEDLEDAGVMRLLTSRPLGS